jgi:lipoprotein-anchoring transpeptidase ErfK/SrfK
MPTKESFHPQFATAGKRKSYTRQILLTIFLLSLLVPILSACGGDPQAQQQASKDETNLNKTLQYAQSIGVPSKALQPIQKQVQALIATQAPLTLFDNTPATQYYNNVSTRSKQLQTQIQGLIQASTEQLDQQAQTNLESLQHTLVTKQHSGLPLDAIKKTYQQDQTNMLKARYPKDYTLINTHASDALTTISMMPTTMDKLTTMQSIIKMMDDGKQDVTTLKQQYLEDQQTLAKVTTPTQLQTLNHTIDTQNAQVASQFTQVIPLLTQAKIDTMSKDVQQLQKNGIDTTTYQKQLDEDEARAKTVKTLDDYTAFAKVVDSHLNGMQTDLLKSQAMTGLKNFHQEVQNWGNAHTYFDKYNGVTYPLDTPYMTKGIGEDLDREVNEAQTTSDYQQAVTDIQNSLLHLQMLEKDANDPTPFDQPHATDKQLMDYYKIQSGQVIVVSFIEEALRVYDNGQLVHSFLITAGRPELPPVPGLWAPLWRRNHITFHSAFPKGSPYWYPDTPINYAVLYHEGGYYLHDSWWRNDYGPGTQFYHVDSSGNTSADYGSHGCINMPLTEAQWVYENTTYNTQILMY